MKYHLYQRTISRNGKQVKAWYYWYYDSNNRQVRKSCGTDGKPCLLKRDAQQFIDNLPENDYLIKLTFGKFCKGFYEPDSKFIIRQKNRGKDYQPHSIYQKKLYLDKFLERFGNTDVKEILAPDVENWLLELPLSNAVRNNIIGVFNDIERELYSYRYIDHIVQVQYFKRNTVSKGTLSLTELKYLFPEDYYELIDRWRISSTEREYDIYSFATMIYTIVSTGMRSCEIRALQWDQLINNGEAILINAMVDSNNERVNHLKKWTNENKKWRVTVLPDRTSRMLKTLRLLQDDDSNKYVFRWKDEEITSFHLLDHFKVILSKNGIEHEKDKRNITIHSLRFTYNTLMRREVSDDDLRLMMGHTQEQMTDYYDKSKAIDNLPGLLINKDSINGIFN